MDPMLILQIIVLFGIIFLGSRLGGLGVGYAGGLGVVLLCIFLKMSPGEAFSYMPLDVVLIIAAVISAISAMQIAGGLDYMVQVAEKILRNNPKYITYLAPTVTFILTLLAGTGHTAFSMFPVIVEVAKSQNIKPSVPLPIAAVSSQIAITASPVSAAVVAMSGLLEPLGISYGGLLAISIPTAFFGIMIAAFCVNLMSKRTALSEDPGYQERVAAGVVADIKSAEYKELPKGAKLSVAIFLIGVLCVVMYALAISKNVGLIEKPPLARDQGIISIMFTVGVLIVICCKVDTAKIPEGSVFKSGMVALLCVLGIAWFGTIFVNGHVEEIKAIAGDTIKAKPFILAIVLFFASSLLYSQAVTTRVMMPIAIAAMGLEADPSQAWVLVASFAAVSGLFILPTYPTVLGAVAMDDTGTTKIGKYIFDHSFIIPGTLAVFFSCLLGFIFAPMFL